MSNDKTSSEKVDNTSSRGFGGMSPEKQDKLRAKSLATRKRNKRLREKNSILANEKREEANDLIAQAEMLRAEADQLDGQDSSKKSKAARNAKLTEEITEQYRDSVSPQYLKMMIQHAIVRGLTVNQIVTPSHAAMDILNSPTSTTAEKKDAMKALQQFENAKPQIVAEVEGNGIGTVQEELNKLMDLHGSVAPKRKA